MSIAELGGGGKLVIENHVQYIRRGFDHLNAYDDLPRPTTRLRVPYISLPYKAFYVSMYSQLLSICVDVFGSVSGG